MLTNQFWKGLSIILAIGVVATLIFSIYKTVSYNSMKSSFEKEQIKTQVAIVQIKALESAIKIQNDKIEEQRINEKINLEKYNKQLLENSKSLQEQLVISSKLKTEKEICDYMSRRSYEILN